MLLPKPPSAELGGFASKSSRPACASGTSSMSSVKSATQHAHLPHVTCIVQIPRANSAACCSHSSHSDEQTGACFKSIQTPGLMTMRLSWVIKGMHG